MRCQIIADFYGENVVKWNTFTIAHFKRMECQKNRHLSSNAVGGCRGVNHAKRKPPKLTIAEELKGKSIINNKKHINPEFGVLSLISIFTFIRG